MIKSISFIVLTQFIHFNELKILRQLGYFIIFIFFLQCILQNSGVFYIFEILNVRQNQILESQTLAKSIHITYSSMFSLLSSAILYILNTLTGIWKFLNQRLPLFGISSEGVCMDIPRGCMLSDKARKLN